jgi:hypothetical protein
MLCLQTLRQTRTLARAVLAWFVLSIGVAVAAPVVQPEALSLVCSASGGSKLVSGNDDGSAPAQGHQVSCVLCMVVSAPPPVQADTLAQLPSLSYVQPAAPGHWITWRTHAPLPARGPPAI